MLQCHVTLPLSGSDFSEKMRDCSESYPPLPPKAEREGVRGCVEARVRHLFLKFGCMRQDMNDKTIEQLPKIILN
jgi:hypothetical protein